MGRSIKGSVGGWGICGDELEHQTRKVTFAADRSDQELGLRSVLSDRSDVVPHQQLDMALCGGDTTTGIRLVMDG